MRALNLFRLAVFGTSLVLVQSALAQETVDPGEVEQRIQQLRPAPKPEAAPGISRPARPPAAPAAEVSFVLTAVTIEGATVLGPDELGPLYAEFLAQSVGPDELEEIARRITARYAEAGYFLTRAVISPQEIQGGVLRVRVVEGYIAKVRFDGAWEQADLLDRYRNRFTAQRPAVLSTVERTILLINSLPGIVVEDVQVAALDGAGGHELIITTRYRPVSADVYIDNRGTPEVGRSQAWTNVGFNSILGTGEEIHAALATVPEDTSELTYGELGVQQPLGTAGTVLGLSFAASDIDAGDHLEFQDTEADSVSLKTEVRHPLVLSRRHVVTLYGSFEFKNIRETRFRTTTIDDRLRVLRAQGDYTFRDDIGGSNYLALQASQGIDILDASGPSEAARSRLDADGRFTKFRFDAVRVQQIWGPISLRLAAQGQVALDPLLSSEEFLLGGPQFGRAFDFAEISGEDGTAGSAEIRFGRDHEGDLLTRYEIYGFYDEGHVWNHGGSSQPSHEVLRSAGGGLRLNVIENVQASVEAAKPLNRAVKSTNQRDVRFFFSLNANF